MCAYFCIGFTDFMLAGKKLTDYTNLCSPQQLKTAIVKKLLDMTRKEKILMLAKYKFNSIDTLIPQVLTDMDISQEEFILILKEKGRYEMMKENLKNKNGES